MPYNSISPIAAPKTSDTSNFTLKSAKSDLEVIYSWGKSQGYEQFGFITEGLGAVFAFMNLPEELVFSILFWPAFNLQHLVEEQFKASENGLQLEEKGFLNYGGIQIGKTFLDELKEADIREYLKLITAPALVFHGERDQIIEPLHLEVLRQDLINSRRVDITVFQDGTHGLENENHRETCLHLATEFIAKYTNRKIK